MSRSGYSDDFDGPELHLYRGAVNQAIRGARGQRLLRDLIAALDAMPVKRLIKEELVTADGDVCALGAVAQFRGEDVSKVDPGDPHWVAKVFDIAEALAREVTYVNDEARRYCAQPGGVWGPITPEQRWRYVREWAVENLRGGE